MSTWGCPYCSEVGRRSGVRRSDHIAAAHPDRVGLTEYEYSRANKARWGQRKAQVSAIYGWRCLCCGRTEAEARRDGRGPITIDHVIPRALGGADDISNWQPLCSACNNYKDNTVVDYRPYPYNRPCEVSVIGRMHWCSLHGQPDGHLRRSA